MTSLVLFLSYIVLGPGLQIKQSKVSVIRDWPCPQSLVYACSFHGLASFNRRFTPHLSSIMVPITDCLCRGQFIWTTHASTTFDDSKIHLISASILVLLDFSKPFELHCDASKLGIRGNLSQLGRPISYLSENL